MTLALALGLACLVVVGTECVCELAKGDAP